ncbi:hypothetical protein R3W88_003403 [Solanum pinnatisectum]|uniref:Uncharacterized protein n=1 Tax=Solanum pinnatisectum TaxID=50273 RepID=A0AAV9MNX8_9SOLN|nr:hypothetical protein R3W88_003403 [Solanum pinnatisectum]
MDSSTLPTFGKKYDFNSVANESQVWSRDVNVSDSSILGYPRAPAFGISSNSHFGTPKLDSYSFGQPAASMSGCKGLLYSFYLDQICNPGNESTPPFLKSFGSRIASYIATPKNDTTGPADGKNQSICGMQTCQDKIQEGLRFEDYQLGDKEQRSGMHIELYSSPKILVITATSQWDFLRTLSFNAAMNATLGQTQNISPGPSTLQIFGKKYDVNSVANEPLLWSRDASVSDSSAFGSLKATSFCVSSHSRLGTPRFNSYSFGQLAVSMSGSKGKESSTPVLKSSDFGKSAFGIIQKGSRTASYISTPDIDSTRLDGREIQSICGIQTYQDISQEYPFAPFKPASSSSTTSTFSPLKNSWSLSTSAPLSPHSVSPSTYPLLAKPSGGAPQSTLCLNCLKQSQPTPPRLCNVSSTPLAACQNTPLFFGPLQPEMTPKVGATLLTRQQVHLVQYVLLFLKLIVCWIKVLVAQKLNKDLVSSTRISVEHPSLETSIQFGISSSPARLCFYSFTMIVKLILFMFNVKTKVVGYYENFYCCWLQVSNNPGPIRRRSSLIIRHSSLSKRMLPKKYKPTSDKSNENAYGVLRTEVIIIPRENPRGWVLPTAEEFPLEADSTMDKMHSDNCDDDKDVDGIMPKLQRADYYTVLPMDELLSKEKEEVHTDGFCSWAVTSDLFKQVKIKDL